MFDREALLTGLIALILVSVIMAVLHREHYEDRKWKLLRARVAALEEIIVGEHE